MLGLALAVALLSPASAHPPLAPVEGEPGSASTVHRAVVPGLAFDPQTGGATPRFVAALKQRPPFEFVSPVRAWTAVTDRFGAPRANGMVHGGIDLALDTHPGSPVLAACSGVITAAGFDSDYGNFVAVDCGWGWSALVAHLSAIAVERGRTIGAGAPVGISGSTGYSTGEHVHFEVRYLGEVVNPEFVLDFLIPPGAPLSTGPIERPTEGAVAPEDVSPVATVTVEGPPAETATPTETTTPPAETTTPPPETPTSTPSPAESPTGTATPTPSPPPAPTPSPTATPGDGATATPTAEPSPTSTETPAPVTSTPTAEPTATPAAGGTPESYEPGS